MPTRSGFDFSRPVVMSSVDGIKCTEYDSFRVKRQMVLDGDLLRTVHCPGWNDSGGVCRCQPCVVCNERICPEGPETAPTRYGNNGVWIGLHCFPCLQEDRPDWARAYLRRALEHHPVPEEH